MNKITELCHQYTNLSENDIVALLVEAQRIESMDEFENYDVFIDTWNVFNNQAVVIYHKPPKQGTSLYHDKVVGKDALRTNEPGVFHTLETKLNSVGLLAETQERRLIHQRIYPILRKQQAVGVTIVESDVSTGVLQDFQGTTGQSTYDDVSATIKMFGQLDTAITDQLADAILVFDRTKHLVLANHAAIELYRQVGYLGNIIGLAYENVSLDGSQFDDTLKQLQELQGDRRFLTRSFNYLSYYFQERKFWNQDSQQLVVLIQDKTDVKSKEAEIISKSAAIREINHRIKNNLQSVISLLRIQQRRLSDEESKKILDESVSRIMAIASTYELMSKQLEDETNLKAAVQLLISHFVQLNEQTQRLKINLDVDPDIQVDSDQVVTISIIVNEALQNVVSHAFPQDQQKMGHATIKARVDHEIITMEIIDDGVGFDLNHTRSGSLGLTIIRNYVKDKLLGQLKIESSSNGTCISFSFDQKMQQ